jgi:hypothetical protein
MRWHFDGEPANTRNMTSDGERHRIAVIRVEVLDQSAPGLLIELLEVGRDPGADRLLVSATTAAGLGRVIEDWLRELSSRPGGRN